MIKKIDSVDDIEACKRQVLDVISPIREIDKNTKVDQKFLFTAQRTKAGSELPPYYLCYFLLVDLLGFKNLGQLEKVSWSVPLDFNGVAFLIEHRKFGVGVFSHDPDKEEGAAKNIVDRVKKAVKIAEPYFEWKAQEATKNTKLNVVNHHIRLFDRLDFLFKEYERYSDEASKRKEERIVEKEGNATIIKMPAWELERKAEWMALSCIEAFFSWTEHVFILLAILKGKVKTGEEVANLADGEWAKKFKQGVGLEDTIIKKFYDDLIIIRRQLRNYLAHGAFGKNGEAFTIHSGAGAVPLLMPHQKGKERFSFYSDLAFQEEEAINLIKEFIKCFWSDDKEIGKIYVESDLPLILPLTYDGKYELAMKSKEDMEALVEHLTYESERAANMDW